MKKFKLITILILINLFILNNTSYAVKIINFKGNFESFWSKAKNKKFEGQEKIWTQEIESIDPSFYEVNVWEKYQNPSWEKSRIETLQKLFSMYAKMDIKKYLDTYDEYENTVDHILKQYKKKAPDYKADITIMIAPGITWGGSYVKNKEVNKEYLALGIDKYFEIISKGDSLQIEALVTHELFHHYHALLQGSKVDKSFENYMKNGKLFWQLWDEGMAVWGTGYITDNENLNYILLRPNVTYDSSKDSYYAKKFLEEINNPAIDLKEPINFKKWFGASGENNPLGSNTPPAIGYYLGWRVIKGIEDQGIDRKTFMSWNYEEAKPYIIEQLKSLAK